MITTRTQIAEGTQLEGKGDYSATLAGIDISRRAAIVDGVLTLEERQLGGGVEIAAAEIGVARDAVARAKSQWIYAVVDDAAPYWRQAEQGRKTGKFDAVLAGYARDIADAPDKSQPLFNRAWFKGEIFDREGAIADLTSAIAIEADTGYYFARANHYRALGQGDKALADLQAAYEVDPSSFGAIQALATLQADRGAGDAALELVDPRVSAGDEEGRNFLALKADVLARNGSAEDAIAAIDSAIAASPRDAGLLNNRCWIKGTMNVSLDTALADCTRSIELGESPASALDSRALVHFRMKRYDEALADLNAALDIAPNMAASLYLRGIVHHAKGNAAVAKADLAAARLMWPPIEQEYKRWSIAP
jgi:tetratricopeptide (TPR) repeat protein